MSNILLLSENKLLADDLAEQIKLAEPEFETRPCILILLLLMKIPLP